MPATIQRGGGRRRTISEINMVPFIDVMLVLLIIFMVTAPLITTGVVDRYVDRLLLLLQRLGAAVGQVNRHASGQERRGHHEDDQQHQHHVDQRGHVDVRHRSTPAAAAL